MDSEHDDIRSLTTSLLQPNATAISFLRKTHLHLVELLHPVYSVDEWQAASITLQKRRGSCSQRSAVLEAIARAAGVPTRVHAFFVKGTFWYPRFRLTRIFIPDSVLLVWPQFYVETEWLDFDELHAPMTQLVADSRDGFTNTGESIFEAVAEKSVDFLGKSCGLACAQPEHDLSRFLVCDHGLFDTRDEVFEKFGSFQHTLRGRAFEFIYGDRKSR
jgi:Transglutaminase-like superfamily